MDVFWQMPSASPAVGRVTTAPSCFLLPSSIICMSDSWNWYLSFNLYYSKLAVMLNVFFLLSELYHYQVGSVSWNSGYHSWHFFFLLIPCPPAILNISFICLLLPSIKSCLRQTVSPIWSTVIIFKPVCAQ